MDQSQEEKDSLVRCKSKKIPLIHIKILKLNFKKIFSTGSVDYID